MYKKWLKYFFIFSIGIMVVLEINYQCNRKNFIRHGLDYKIHNTLPDSANKKIDTIVFGNSVTYGPMRQYKIKDRVLDLCTVHSVGILGQYFMLQRYLQKNRVNSVYLFVLPQNFYMDLSSINDIYIESVFEKQEEKIFLRTVREEKYEVNYFYSRINYFKFWKSTYRYFDRKILEIDQDRVILYPTRISQKPNNISETSKKVNEKFDFVFNRFVQLCNENNIDLVIVMEPMIEKEYKKYKVGPISEYIKSHDLKLFELNQIHTFQDKDFHDSIHLNEIEAKKYMYIVDKYIVDFL